MSDGAIAAARRALDQSDVAAGEIEVLISGSGLPRVFRAGDGLSRGSGAGGRPRRGSPRREQRLPGSARVEWSRSPTGSSWARSARAWSSRCETAREINEIVIAQLLENATMDFFKRSLATLTGGSGAVAVLLTDGSFSPSRRRKLLGGAVRTAPRFHELCRWGIEASAARHAA